MQGVFFFVFLFFETVSLFFAQAPKQTGVGGPWFAWLCFHIAQLSGRRHRSGTASSADLYIVALLERLIDVGHREGSARLSSLLVCLGLRIRHREDPRAAPRIFLSLVLQHAQRRRSIVSAPGRCIHNPNDDGRSHMPMYTPRLS